MLADGCDSGGPSARRSRAGSPARRISWCFPTSPSTRHSSAADTAAHSPTVFAAAAVCLRRGVGVDDAIAMAGQRGALDWEDAAWRGWHPAGLGRGYAWLALYLPSTRRRVRWLDVLEPAACGGVATRAGEHLPA